MFLRSAKFIPNQSTPGPQARGQGARGQGDGDEWRPGAAQGRHPGHGQGGYRAHPQLRDRQRRYQAHEGRRQVSLGGVHAGGRRAVSGGARRNQIRDHRAVPTHTKVPDAAHEPLDGAGVSKSPCEIEKATKRIFGNWATALAPMFTDKKPEDRGYSRRLRHGLPR